MDLLYAEKGSKMNTNVLGTKRHWSWGVFLVLLGLNILAAFAIQPYLTVLQRFSSQTGANASTGGVPFWLAMLISIAQSAVVCGIGLLLANRIGLGLPFVEGWIKRKPVPTNFGKIVAIAWIAAVGCAVSIYFLSTVVFDPPMYALLAEKGVAVPQAADMPPLFGLLASYFAGVSEETFCRLLGMSLVAWLGGLLFHDSNGRPRAAVMWVAIIALALEFGIGHLRSAAGMGWPMDPLIITRALVLNGIVGVAFGWLFWKYGLESAILAHALADVIIQAMIPFTAMWQGEPARTVAIAGVVIVILATLIWAGRSLITANRKDTQGGALKAA
jgi:hypothetical protein